MVVSEDYATRVREVAGDPGFVRIDDSAIETLSREYPAAEVAGGIVAAYVHQAAKQQKGRPIVIDRDDAEAAIQRFKKIQL